MITSSIRKFKIEFKVEGCKWLLSIVEDFCLWTEWKRWREKTLRFRLLQPVGRAFYWERKECFSFLCLPQGFLSRKQVNLEEENERNHLLFVWWLLVLQADNRCFALGSKPWSSRSLSCVLFSRRAKQFINFMIFIKSLRSTHWKMRRKREISYHHYCW